ncbi:FAD-dependent monooxygenase [Cupriavidus sp. CV2]|uniref:FAD-dependent monooxygenase n=1 Tax=Cupriavidus ulmosensis TaxID=3065913 RepID=UPI00296B15EE|nr:FAD-dependent monooxygenase [Cupriavidus sp. CV2]MDW3688236.1 FAD-dependent monooxygenase [Cupriavidus sp. CV2]
MKPEAGHRRTYPRRVPGARPVEVIMNATTSTTLRPAYDVIVAGLGPAGATLANLLALRGLSVLALDREADIYRLPRAIHFDGECMRVFQTIGIADEMAPGLVVAPGMKFVDAAGRPLLDWPRPTHIGPQGWHHSYRFHQPNLEEALRQRLRQQPHVDIRLRHGVFALEQQRDDMLVRMKDMPCGQLLHTRARYVVGCDGARSTVRRFMGTALEDLGCHERWLGCGHLLCPHREASADRGGGAGLPAYVGFLRRGTRIHACSVIHQRPDT